MELLDKSTLFEGNLWWCTVAPWSIACTIGETLLPCISWTAGTHDALVVLNIVDLTVLKGLVAGGNGVFKWWVAFQS